MQAVATSRAPESRTRELVAGLLAGTPGRLRVFGAVAITACLLFAGLGFVSTTRLNDALGETQARAQQLVRIQTIRTSLVAADANATNAFLVGGLEPTAARRGYTAGIRQAATTLAQASSASAGDAAKLRSVNTVLADYAGLIESARANNRQGFPIGAAYLRQASALIRAKALPALEQLVANDQDAVQRATDSADQAQVAMFLLLLVVLIALVITQLWLLRRTHRVLNVPLAVATVAVLVSGVVALGAMAWSQSIARDARNGPYVDTVALATARINGFDAKSAESLTLIARGSGQAYEMSFEQLTKSASDALHGTNSNTGAGPTIQTISGPTSTTLAQYLVAHREVRAADDRGDWDGAVKLATGAGAANQAFTAFEVASSRELNSRATKLSDDLDRARIPLFALSWLLLVVGLGAAVGASRGIAQRLREYR